MRTSIAIVAIMLLVGSVIVPEIYKMVTRNRWRKALNRDLDMRRRRREDELV